MAPASEASVLNPVLTFFLGKGGVGKTTVSTAYALHRAGLRKRVVLISTDPAHSLGDVLQLALKPGLQKLTGAHGLSVWQIDPAARFQEFLDEYRGSLTELVEQGTFLSRSEVESFLQTALPGLAEVSALLSISDLLESSDFDEIVVDTAPIGHTLQLFRIPEQLARFLEFLELAGRRDRVLAEHFGGNVGAGRPKVIESWEATLASLRQALSGDQSQLVMITSAEKFSLEEASRTASALGKDTGATIATVVLNRVVTRADGCKRCARRLSRYRAACNFVADRFPTAKVLTGEDPGAPILGADRLRRFGDHVFGGKPLTLTFRAPQVGQPARFTRVPWPEHLPDLTFTLGKGGVGKTTISGGLAFSMRHKEHSELLICSTDPAPSLDDLFEQEVGAQPRTVLHDAHFRAVEVDSAQEYLSWSSRIKRLISESLQMQQGGVHVELSFEHEMLSALLDIVPPGVDEIFAVFKLLDFVSARKQKLVVDMAPTGHALELLRTPERLVVWSRLLLKSLSVHRKLPLAQELAVEVASISQRARELTELLKNRQQTSIFVVMLPEPLPDHQTTRLFGLLARLGLEPKAVFVNRMLPRKDTVECERCTREWQWQRATLARLDRGDTTHFAVPEFTRAIAGASGLKHLTKRLWQVQ